MSGGTENQENEMVIVILGIVAAGFIAWQIFGGMIMERQERRKMEEEERAEAFGEKPKRNG